LQQALEEWEKHCDTYPDNPKGVIRILDNGVYGGNVAVNLPPGAQLAIIADNGARPTIRLIGSIKVMCTAAKQNTGPETAEVQNGSLPDGAAQPPAINRQNDDAGRAAVSTQQLLLNGLLVYGGIHISEAASPLAKQILSVTIGHCTLMPFGISATLNEPNARGLEISCDHCIVGPLYLPQATGSLTLIDSIIDHAGHGSKYAIAGADKVAAGPAVNLARVTVFGQVNADQVTARDVIFTERVIAPQPAALDQQVQYSYVPADSMTPEHLPYYPMSKRIEPPVFTSRQFGDPAYAQLSKDCPLDIRGGASDGSEMGAFHELHSLQAEANIQPALDEYLPAGLQASIFYVT
jgi:hypothetical protein